MKKIFIAISIICVLILSSAVFADMGAPEINRYKATPRSTEGAKYYEYSYDAESDTAGLVEVGIIPYGQIITIDFETLQDDVRYGYFTFENDENIFQNYEVKLEDLYVTNSNEAIPSHSDKVIQMKVLANDIPIHSGPAYVYDVIGSIPRGTDINVYRIMKKDYYGNLYEEEMNPWLYVEYNDGFGWVCELNSALGRYVDEDLVIKVDVSFSGDEIAIPANTKINGYYRTDMWSNNAYVSYEGKNYIISLYDCAVETQDWYDEWYEIKYDSASIYRAASKESDVLLDKIPNGTMLPIIYVEYDLRWIGWIYTEYNGVKGWVIYFEDDDALREYLDGEYDVGGSETATVTLVEDNDKPLDNTDGIEKNNENSNVTPKQENQMVADMVIYIGAAIIIALTATVIILLINQKKK